MGPHKGIVLGQVCYSRIWKVEAGAWEFKVSSVPYVESSLEYMKLYLKKIYKILSFLKEIHCLLVYRSLR